MRTPARRIALSPRCWSSRCSFRLMPACPREQCGQVTRFELVERLDRRGQVAWELRLGSAGGELLELSARLRPAHRARQEAFVVRFLGCEGRAVDEVEAEPTCVLGRKS